MKPPELMLNLCSFSKNREISSYFKEFSLNAYKTKWLQCFLEHEPPDCWLEITGEENNLAVNFWDLKKKRPCCWKCVRTGHFISIKYFGKYLILKVILFKGKTMGKGEHSNKTALCFPNHSALHRLHTFLNKVAFLFQFNLEHSLYSIPE